MTGNPGSLSRGRRIVLYSLAVALISLVLYALLGGLSDSRGGLRLSEALFVGAAVVGSIRVVSLLRRKVRTSPVSIIDSPGIQPGESISIRTGSQEITPVRLLEIEGMVRSAAADPEYFETTLKAFVDELNLDEDVAVTVPEIEEIGKLRWFSVGRSRIRKRNIQRIQHYVEAILPYE